MTDLEHLLPLWRELEAAGTEYVLATVVAVEGPSYRKPGARMLLGMDGRRAGTVSGGCLEAEVAKRAWWLTAHGPAVERYSTVEDDGERPYGSGCGGVVFILLERRETAGPLLAGLESAFNRRIPLAIATILDGPGIGHRAFAMAEAPLMPDASSSGRSSTEPTESPEHNPAPAGGELQDLAQKALEVQNSFEEALSINGCPTRTWGDYRRARPGLWIFGAGDDAKPLVRLARELGWFVAVSDGRSHLAKQDRFPEANQVRVMPPAKPPGEDAVVSGIKPGDAAVVMAHAFEQDARVLAALLVLDCPPAYLGVLGPQRRTRELLAEAAHALKLPEIENRVERWLEGIHAPMGLDLGADTSAAIALSILAEIQQSLAGASGLPMRRVRAAAQAVRGLR